MLERRQAANPEEADLVSSVADRMTDQAIASFMARAVAADRRGTERLAQALEALAPAHDRKSRVVDLAKAEALQGELGADAGFESMWEDVANTVMSDTLVSNLTNVSDEYGRELSAARKQAIEVERVSDDPPERVQAWVTTVTEPAVAQLDLRCSSTCFGSRDRRAGSGNRSRHRERPRPNVARSPVTSRARMRCSRRWSRETKTDGRPASRASATRTWTVWERARSHGTSRSLPKRHDSEVDRFNQLCQILGAERGPAAGRSAGGEKRTAARFGGCATLLLGFGAAGRRSVEQLKNSPNPAVRRTAITCCACSAATRRCPSWRRCSTMPTRRCSASRSAPSCRSAPTDAYAVLQRALARVRSTPRDTVLRSWSACATTRPCRCFCYVLKHSAAARQAGRASTSQIIEALGDAERAPGVDAHVARCSYRGEWWAPFRTAALRQAAAAALRRHRNAAKRWPCSKRRSRTAAAACATSRARTGGTWRATGERARHELAASARGWPTSSSRRLAAALRGAQLYAPDHPHRHAQHHGRSPTRWRSSTRPTPSIAIGIVGDELVVGDSPGAARRREHGRADAPSAAGGHRAHRDRPRRRRRRS